MGNNLTVVFRVFVCPSIRHKNQNVRKLWPVSSIRGEQFFVGRFQSPVDVSPTAKFVGYTFYAMAQGLVAVVVAVIKIGYNLWRFSEQNEPHMRGVRANI